MGKKIYLRVITIAIAFLISAPLILASQTISAASAKCLDLLFTEGTGNTVHDSSGNGINATNNGAQWVKLDTGKWVLSFDGNNDALVCPYSPALNIAGATAQVTMEAWVSLDQIKSGMWLGNAFNGTIGGYLLFYDNDYYRQAVGCLENSNGWLARAYGSTPVVTGIWHHVVYTFDGSYGRIYIDGILNSTSTVLSSGMAATSHPFQVYAGFGGKIGKISVYNYSLSQSQINNIYLGERGNYYSIPTATTIYVCPPFANTKILPDTIIPAQYVSNRISLSGAPGEYKSATFVVHPVNDIALLNPVVAPLTGSVGTIGETAVNLRVVKDWYQAGVEIADVKNKILTPELLLKDDSLIKIENQQNYVKLTNGTYKWISDPTLASQQNYPISVNDLPIKDTDTLQPVNITAATNKQFWITLKIPDNAIAGSYSGKISLVASGGSIGEIQLTLQVLPIKLAEPNLTYGLTYRGILDGRWPQGNISSSYKSSAQMTVELQNMVQHGVTNPTVSQYLNSTLLSQMMSARAAAGMLNKDIYYMGIGPWGYENINEVQSVISLLRNYGTQKVYFYGVDEATGTTLTDQRASWTNIRAAGGKIFAAGWNNLDQVYPAMGDILDCFIYGRTPNAPEAAKWHSVGHQILSYNNPVAGVENPYLNRKNYGLLLWQSNFDGVMSFAYQCEYGNIWNDFDFAAFRDHVYAYPTINGVIDTIQWEGFREGVNDIRYLTTLTNTINQAKSLGQNTAAAESWLASLKSVDLTTLNLDDVRTTMVNYILSLNTGAATISISNLNQVYDGTAKSVTVTTNPAGLNVAVTYNGATTLPVGAGSYSVAATITGSGYSGTASGTLVVAKATPVFSGLSSPTISAGTSSVNMGGNLKAGSLVPTGTVSVSVNGITQTVLLDGAGNFTTTLATSLFTGGSYSISYSYPGNNNFNNAVNSAAVLTVSSNSAMITLSNLNQVYDGTAKSVTVTTNPAGLNVAVTYNGATTLPVSPGRYRVVATITTSGYSGTASGTLIIGRKPRYK